MPGTTNQGANRLQHGRDNNGWRDFLNGEPIFNGSLLMLKSGSTWLCVRYEISDYARREIRGNHNGGTMLLDRETMLFRRLTPEERETVDREEWTRQLQRWHDFS